ncbi:MFS transporter [Rhizobium lusitanum]|uniref:DHA2 family methylenomycin A resistance protein-like MFS transporter n=1 Tax=Rhizobium lusitanum TaxID=293958 RepID=A0A7X0MFI3_9HYPH|nr:MFS transporter [Rhizobium lusitanum]MBB6488799.1 DHA2 family methylenomycin A resistance protein-like MFS transporter [Rhizobium lusitanum]
MSLTSQSRSRPLLTLVGSAFGFILVLLDVSVVNVALDALGTSFETDIVGLEWVVNAYTLVFAALLLTAGALGDRFGVRTIFVLGFVLFTASSVACGWAPTLTMLIAGRIAQGVGAALLVPNSLALIQQAFPTPAARSRAIGWWGAIAGSSLAAGPVVGGLLVAHLGWRSIFLVNLPVGIVGLAIILFSAHESPKKPGRSLDWPGQIAIVGALGALAMTLVEAGGLGWSHPRIILSGLLALLGIAAFLWIEVKSKEPMLPLTLFGAPAFSIASINGVLINFAYYGMIFVFSLFFQWEMKLSASETGFAFLPMTIMILIVNLVMSRVMTMASPRVLMVFGQCLSAAGYLLLIPASATGSYATLVLPMLMAATGMAVMVPTVTNVTLASAATSQGGIASGVLNTARQVGGMLGVAIFGYLVRDAAPSAFLFGMRMSFAIAAGLLLLGGLLSFLGLRAERKNVTV